MRRPRDRQLRLAASCPATQLRAGMSENQVEALLGTPLARTSGASSTWRHRYVQQIRECRYYVGPIPLQPARKERHELELIFGTAGLSRAVYREVAPDRRTERVVVGAPKGADLRAVCNVATCECS